MPNIHHVLLLEREPIVRLATSRTLEESGCQVLLGDLSVDTALEMLQSSPQWPQAAVLSLVDWEDLPVVEDLVRQMRQATPLQLVVSTGLNIQNLKSRSPTLNKAVNAFLNRPASPQQLQRALGLAPAAQQEEASWQTVQLKELTLETFGFPLLLVNDNRQIEWFNEAFETLTGYSRQDLHGRELDVLIPEEVHQLAREAFDAFMQTGEDRHNAEWPVVLKNGGVRYVIAKGVRFADQQGRYFKLMSLTDTSSLRYRLRQLEQEVEQGSLLFQEMNHRVKNNLNLLSSLFFLETAQHDSPVVTQALMEAIGRIRSLAEMHDHLSLSAQLGAVQLDRYLQDLLDKLADSYSKLHGGVRIHTEFDSLETPAQAAVNLGLIVNEVVTNSYKYAFQDQTQGEIHLKLENLGRQGGALTIYDNGQGLQQPFEELKAHSLGFQLIDNLLQMLNGGRLEVAPGPGTRFRILFGANLRSGNQANEQLGKPESA